jgi:hypothetical protein
MLASSHPYWTDYVGAFGTVVGILVAGAAFVVARRSAADSTRSANSADRTAKAAEAISEASQAALEAATAQLEVARREHGWLEAERARRPIVDRVELSEIRARPGEETPPGVFRVGFINSGDRDLQGAILTILVDPGCAAVLTDRWGNPDLDQSKDETHERWPGVTGVPRAFDFFARRVNAEVGVASLQYVCVPRAGRFPLRVKLFHAGLAGRGTWVDAWIDLNEQGVAGVVRLSDAGFAGEQEGRCDDFDRSPI